MSIFSKVFWRSAIERAVRTAAQTFVVVAGLSETFAGLIHVNWLAALQAAAWAALASVLMYIYLPPTEEENKG